jgi:hypothetical protein
VKHARELGKIRGAGGGFTPRGSFIAGGALTSAFSNVPINDVDYYFKSEQAFYEAIEQAYENGWWAVSATDRSVTFAQDDMVIQLVYFEYFDTAAAVFDAFDFTCCMGAYDIDAKDFVFHDKFLKHVAQRHLSFHEGTRFPFVSLLRVSKYQQKGYSIGHGDILRIALRCHGSLLWPGMMPGKVLDVGVDADGFEGPMSFEKIKAIMDTRQIVSYDHHKPHMEEKGDWTL